MAVFWGVVLGELAAFTLALAMNVQRFALSADPAWFKGRTFFCTSLRLTRDRLWGCGMLLYGTANGIYFCGLSFAPLSLMSALFATMLVFNAVLARFLLGEELTRTDMIGLGIILAAVATLGYFGPTESKEYSADDIASLFHVASGFLFVIAMVGVLLVLRGLIWRFERLYPFFGLTGEGQQEAADENLDQTKAVPARLALAMMVIYPTILGIFESLVQICLKAISSMLLKSSAAAEEQENQIGKPLFWVMVVGLCIGTVCVIMWLRKVYARFETTDGLPIEYGVVTTVSILAGLSVYQEVEYTDEGGEVAMAIAMGCILVGIGITVACKHDRTPGAPSPKDARCSPEKQVEGVQERRAKQRRKSIAKVLGTRLAKVPSFRDVKSKTGSFTSALKSLTKKSSSVRPTPEELGALKSTASAAADALDAEAEAEEQRTRARSRSQQEALLEATTLPPLKLSNGKSDEAQGGLMVASSGVSGGIDGRGRVAEAAKAGSPARRPWGRGSGGGGRLSAAAVSPAPSHATS